MPKSPVIAPSPNNEAAQCGHWIRPYYPAFDGLRGAAILAVFYCHYGEMADPHLHRWFTWTGVDLFFVLSGFLITGILYDSRNNERYFRVFYARRALRIFPLYYGLFVALLLLTPVLHLVYSAAIWSNLLYVGNLVSVFFQLGHAHNPHIMWIFIHGHGLAVELSTFWSLAVEEQFYLLWPLVIWFFRSRTTLLRICTGMILATAALRTLIVVYSPRLRTTDIEYTQLFTRCDALLIGAWLALWLRGAKLERVALRRLAGTLIVASAATVVVLIRTLGLHGEMDHPLNPGLTTFGYTFVGLAGAGVLLLCLDETSFVHRALLYRPLAKLGRISYGFYVLHYLLFFFFASFTKHFLAPRHLGLLILPIAFFYSLGAAYVSFRFLESPFLRLKRYVIAGHPSIPKGTEEG
jgi:peptidoglycan/LPS O-acetylase OafA/YrhL